MIVVDSNIVFSSLLTADSTFLSILLDDKNKFISPYFLFVELFKHKEKIIKHSKLSQDSILEILDSLLSNIQFIPVNSISLFSRERAYRLCKDIDMKDAVFVALTIEYEGLLWTGDKVLSNGLIKKGFDRFYHPQL
jgi:predicted nucleic acid-binding protein